MTGVDATGTVVNRGRQRCQEEGLADRIRFVLGDVCEHDVFRFIGRDEPRSRARLTSGET